MDIRNIRTPGLGDATYLLSHAGLGLVVDPQRDVDRFLAAADDMQIKVRYVLLYRAGKLVNEIWQIDPTLTLRY